MGPGKYCRDLSLRSDLKSEPQAVEKLVEVIPWLKISLSKDRAVGSPDSVF